MVTLAMWGWAPFCWNHCSSSSMSAHFSSSPHLRCLCPVSTNVKHPVQLSGALVPGIHHCCIKISFYNWYMYSSLELSFITFLLYQYLKLTNSCSQLFEFNYNNKTFLLSLCAMSLQDNHCSPQFFLCLVTLSNSCFLQFSTLRYFRWLKWK